jgi:hypothetical protein
MLQIGHYTGSYRYNDKRASAIIGHPKTNFEIEIMAIDGHTFTGKVQDDLNTGGTEGVGSISGTIINNSISFVKRMPIRSIRNIKTGVRKTYNQKHRPIYYTGKISDDGLLASGTWRFKFGFIWFGILPVPMASSSGTWEMTKNPLIQLAYAVMNSIPLAAL